MKFKKIRNYILWGLAGIGFIWFIYNQFIKQPPVAIDFMEEEVAAENLYQEVSATGTINPVEMIEVGTQVSGQISEILVDYNDEVKEGQVLARMDMRNLKSSLKESNANLEKTKVLLDQAKKNLDRTKDLHAKGFSSDLDLETANNDYQNALAAYNVAKIQKEKNSVNLGYADIISPLDGIVISKNVEVGQTVAATFSTPKLFVIAKDLSQMKIEASVDEADIGQVKPGQFVIFTVDAFPDDEFSGTVGQVQLQPNVIQNVVTYNVIIMINNPDMKLLPGMTATLLIRTEEKNNAVSIPNSALAFDPEKYDWDVLKSKGYSMKGSDTEGESVWILKDKTLTEKEVTVDFTNGIRSSISSGLEPGEFVVTNLKIKIGEEQNGNLFQPKKEDEEE